MDTSALVGLGIALTFWCAFSNAVIESYGMGWGVAFFFSPVVVIPVVKAIWLDAKNGFKDKPQGG